MNKVYFCNTNESNVTFYSVTTVVGSRIYDVLLRLSSGNDERWLWRLTRFPEHTCMYAYETWPILFAVRQSGL